MRAGLPAALAPLVEVGAFGAQHGVVAARQAHDAVVNLRLARLIEMLNGSQRILGIAGTEWAATGMVTIPLAPEVAK